MYICEYVQELLHPIFLRTTADERNEAIIQSATESSKLMADFGFSSVSMLYMVIAIEEVFQIQFDNVSVSDFDTLGDVVNYIEAAMK